MIELLSFVLLRWCTLRRYRCSHWSRLLLFVLREELPGLRVAGLIHPTPLVFAVFLPAVLLSFLVLLGLLLTTTFHLPVTLRTPLVPGLVAVLALSPPLLTVSSILAALSLTASSTPVALLLGGLLSTGSRLSHRSMPSALPLLLSVLLLRAALVPALSWTRLAVLLSRGPIVLLLAPLLTGLALLSRRLLAERGLSLSPLLCLSRLLTSPNVLLSLLWVTTLSPPVLLCASLLVELTTTLLTAL